MTHHRSRPLGASVFLASLTVTLAGFLGVLVALVVHEPRPPVADHRMEHVVPVPPVEAAARVFCVESAAGVGSGVPIARVGDRVVFLTCRHVVDADTGYFVHSLDGVAATVDRVIRSDKQDVALLWVRLPDLEPLSLRYDVPPFGETVYAAGWPMGKALHLTQGFVGGRTSDGRQTFSAPIFFGNSGGAVLDAAGRVVGLSVAVFRSPDGQVVSHMAVVLPVAEFQDWLAEALTR